MKYDLNKLPDKRGAKKKYPWEKLKMLGDYFEWDNLEDRKNITASSTFHKMKVSCREVDGKLHVIRVG